MTILILRCWQIVGCSSYDCCGCGFNGCGFSGWSGSALWSRAANNPDLVSFQATHLSICLSARTDHLIACYARLASLAHSTALNRSLACSLTHSWLKGMWMIRWFFVFFSVLHHSAVVAAAAGGQNGSWLEARIEKRNGKPPTPKIPENFALLFYFHRKKKKENHKNPPNFS